MKVKVLAAAICFVLIPVRSSFGITIDPFNTNQSTNSTLPTNIVSPAEALGGTRKILAKKTAGSLGKVSTDSFYDPSPGINNGALFHSQDAGIVGESLLTWDGTSSSSFNAFGLGGIDFTKDGSSALLLSVLEFNAPSSGGVIVKFTAHYGSISASASLTVTTPGTLTFPFSAFVVSPGVPFDFSKVGALTMNIAGGSAADLTIDFLKQTANVT